MALLRNFWGILNAILGQPTIRIILIELYHHKHANKAKICYKKWVLSHLYCSTGRSSFGVSAYFLGADAGKTIDRLLTTHLLQTNNSLFLQIIKYWLQSLGLYEPIWLILTIFVTQNGV